MVWENSSSDMEAYFIKRAPGGLRTSSKRKSTDILLKKSSFKWFRKVKPPKISSNCFSEQLDSLYFSFTRAICLSEDKLLNCCNVICSWRTLACRVSGGGNSSVFAKNPGRPL